jgi:processive 1,2-diacylglycerol beta-glucosyltransferase
MKILIVYASAGAGHRSAAEALYNYLKTNRQSWEIKFADCLDQTTFLFRVGYRKGYSLLVRRALVFWELAFWLTDFKPFRVLSRPLARLNNWLNTLPFSQYLKNEQFDYIISTHFLPSDISALLKRNREINSKLITVITDYEAHNYWICPATDIYVVACRVTGEELVAEGAPADAVREYGIPIDMKFTLTCDKASSRRKLGLDAHKFTCLLMTGSFGIGPLKDIALGLCAKAQVILLCSHNKKLFTELSAKRLPGVKVLGFVDNLQDYMAAADVIVTKPGGLSIAEAVSTELVPLFISPIPGQETGNIRTLARYGVGLSLRNAQEACNAVLRYKDSPGRLQAAREAVSLLKKRDCLEDISRLIS